MKFEFLKLNAAPSNAFPNRQSNLRPIIPIHLGSVDFSKRVHYYALLDTGADYNLFHAELAELIGISNYRSGKEQIMFGIEGEGIKSYFHNIIIEVGGWKYRSYSAFTDFDGKRKLDQMPYGILGQVGFFDMFKAQFDYEKAEIEVKQKDLTKFC